MLKLRKTISLGLAAGALAMAGAGIAQEVSSDPHQQMVDVFANDSMRDRAFESIMKSAFGSIVETDPQLAALEMECPGFIDGLSSAMRPLMKRTHNEDHIEYRKDLLALLRSELTAEEAAGAAEFFASDLGQRFFDEVFANQNMDNVMREAMATGGEEDISASSLNKDNNTTAIRAMMSLEPVERRAIMNKFVTEDWGKAFSKMRPKMDALLTDPKYQQTTPEEDAEIEAVSVEFSTNHFEKCFAGQ